MPLIYLAGAIDRAKEDPGKLIDRIKEELIKAWAAWRGPRRHGPLVMYSPFKAFQGSMGISDKNHATPLFRINMVAVEEADLLLVHYQPGVETWGTPMEVLRAHTRTTPVLAWFFPTQPITELPPYLEVLTDVVHEGHPASVAKVAVNMLRKERIDVQEES